ncbi:MAG: type II secretion system ATPase GspE [Desulfuromonadales bacterium]|nr:type II secretion system ATPase GspE [Desulfuromonadales bacterium]
MRLRPLFRTKKNNEDGANVKNWRKLGDILQSDYAVTHETIEAALAQQSEQPEQLGQILCREHALASSVLRRALADQLTLPFMEKIPDDTDLQELIALLPIAYVREHLLLPLELDEQRLLVVVADPFAVAPINDLSVLFARAVQICVTTPEEIRRAINLHYEKTAGQGSDLQESGSDGGLANLEPADLIDTSDEAPVIRFVNSLLTQAYREKASDIHIEPGERDLVIRFRIDGVLHEMLRPPLKSHAAIVSRIKIMSHLDIAEKRLPQDGRLGVRIAGRDVDVRISVLPTDLGERVVLRLLDRSSEILTLEDLGLADSGLHAVDAMIRKSHGIFLVTGPTGSGKTTTLYAALTRLNDRERNIITVEDPVEYRLSGVGQIQVNQRINLTFAAGLRSILRQDPDLIMVGEIRDGETAGIAVQSALTGHMVFSTLHTNDAATALTRLVEMGVEPFLAASSIVGILAQRLVRKICPDCREGYVPDPQLLKEAGFVAVPAGTKFYRGAGCDLCHDTGYRGRLGIFELLTMSDKVRSGLMANTDAVTIRQLAIDEGMLPLRQFGLQRILKGETSIEEVLRVTQEEG